MNKKKKIILAIASVSVIVTAFLGGSSFSKYAAQIQGNAVADVANWDFKVNGNSEQIATINLTSENDVTKIAQNKIAPGTKGSFNIIVDASDAEVGIEYKITIEDEQNVPHNLKFKYNGTIFNNLKEIEKNFNGTIDANSEEKVKTFKIEWEWPYTTGENPSDIETNDKQDTNDAKQGDYSCNIKVTGIQVKPQAE